MITGFHSETSEQGVIQLLKESITEIGMTMENARIECTAKPKCLRVKCARSGLVFTGGALEESSHTEQK